MSHRFHTYHTESFGCASYIQVTIREALQELVAWSQTAELKLVDHEENGRRTPLIRDWSDVFLELGDKQSLLASLKESQFFKAFEDQGITYEVRRPAVPSPLSVLWALSYICIRWRVSGQTNSFLIRTTFRLMTCNSRDTGEARELRLRPAHAEPDTEEMGVPGTDLRNGSASRRAGAVPTRGRRLPRYHGEGEGVSPPPICLSA